MREALWPRDDVRLDGVHEDSPLVRCAVPWRIRTRSRNRARLAQQRQLARNQPARDVRGL